MHHTVDMASTECKQCGSETDELATFPGGICLDCYRQTPEANAPLTSADVVAMWGGPVRRRRAR